MPKSYYVQKIVPTEKQNGIIVMEDLSEKGVTLGIEYVLTVEQVGTSKKKNGISWKLNWKLVTQVEKSQTKIFSLKTTKVNLVC